MFPRITRIRRMSLYLILNPSVLFPKFSVHLHSVTERAHCIFMFSKIKKVKTKKSLQSTPRTSAETAAAAKTRVFVVRHQKEQQRTVRSLYLEVPS